MSPKKEPFVCPRCEAETPVDRSRSDLVTCPGCGAWFWALDGDKRGRSFRLGRPRQGALWTAWVLGVSSLVLFAELTLALVLYGGVAYAIILFIGRA